MTRWIRAAAFLASAAALAMAPGLAAAQEVIKIGVNEPLTGAVAASGNYVVNGAKIAADAINADGGVLGKQIELIIEDNQSNPTAAVAAAEKLIVRDEVPVMMGAWSSTYTLAVMPKLMEYEVPMVVETSTSDKVTTSGNPWVFRTGPTNGMMAEAFAEYADELEIRKGVFLVVNNDWGLGVAQEFSDMLAAQGVEIGAVETMAPEAQDLSSQLSKLKASDADTLFVTTEVSQLTLVMRQARALQVPQQIIAATGSSSPDQIIDQAGAAADGVYFIVFFTPWFPDAMPNPDVAESFVEEWKARGHNFAGLTEGFRGYDGITTIAAAIEKAGKAEPEAIRDALWEVEVQGLNGDIAFVKEGPKGMESGQNQANVYVVMVKGGEVVRPEF